MISDQPALVMARSVVRPDRARMDALAGAPTGFLVDALGGRGGMDPRIRPLDGTPPQLFGPALTCRTGPDDNLAVFGALDLARAGDIVVIAADGWTGSAVIGDNVAGMLGNRGVAGIVTDGMVRDAAGVRAVGLPVFCRGITPDSPARQGPGTAGLPVTLGGVRVAAGDIVAADGDGVVVVPQERLDGVAAALPGIAAAEAEMAAQVAAGLGQAPWFSDLVAAGRVVRSDGG